MAISYFNTPLEVRIFSCVEIVSRRGILILWFKYLNLQINIKALGIFLKIDTKNEIKYICTFNKLT